MSEIRALVIPAGTSEPARVTRVIPEHRVFCALVADLNTDTVFFADGDGLAKVSANAKSLASHLPNPRATQVLERFVPGFAKRDRVEGPAVFVGVDDEGDLVDVAQAVLDFAAHLFPVQHTA